MKEINEILMILINAGYTVKKGTNTTVYYADKRMHQFHNVKCEVVMQTSTGTDLNWYIGEVDTHVNGRWIKNPVPAEEYLKDNRIT